MRFDTIGREPYLHAAMSAGRGDRVRISSIGQDRAPSPDRERAATASAASHGVTERSRRERLCNLAAAKRARDARGRLRGGRCSRACDPTCVTGLTAVKRGRNALTKSVNGIACRSRSGNVSSARDAARDRDPSVSASYLRAPRTAHLHTLRTRAQQFATSFRFIIARINDASELTWLAHASMPLSTD